MIWYGLTLSLKRCQQFSARFRRPGQVSTHVFLNHIVAWGTFDERLVKLLVGSAKT
jgi:hypothetical protein